MEGCLFCGIVASSVPSTAVLETEHCYAFRDTNPAAPVHDLVVPKDHLGSAEDLGVGQNDLLGDPSAAIRAVPAKEGIAGTGYRAATKAGADAGRRRHT